MKKFKNILITGAQGFIGKNLIHELTKNEFYNIIELNRDTPWSEIEKIITSIDLIFHLAGEVRPKSDDDAFNSSNVLLTERLLLLLEEKKYFVPIIMASTIHAKLQGNQYGITKRKAEILIENFSQKHKINMINYRLPHVFGEGCKPNYNSVISTWIHNSINDKEIVIFDRNISMEYVYVQDIIKTFVAYLENIENNDEIYLYPKITYKTTLGEVVDYIDEFKKNIYSDNNDDFKRKLYLVYQDYLKMN
jgi:UDP-2-acetamido-2,6-beta-L-arabino-hexul-4-ose reductase